MKLSDAFSEIKTWLAADKGVAISPIDIDEDGEPVGDVVWTVIADAVFVSGGRVAWAAPFQDGVHTFEAHDVERVKDGALELQGPEADGVAAMRIRVRRIASSERRGLGEWLTAEERGMTKVALERTAEVLVRQPRAKAPKAQPKREFRFSRRYTRERSDQSWTLTGVYVTDGREILFSAALGFEYMEDDENAGLGESLDSGGQTANSIMEYLWDEGSNGYTISCSRPELVRARTLEHAATVALGLAVKSAALHEEE